MNIVSAITPAQLPEEVVAARGYRADIDGLRAIAVLAVVLAHAGVPGFSGGFVGVDMFFVISGYLITRNLERAPPSGWRGLLAFYGRRTRRTLPALYLVLGVTLAAALVLLLPGEIVNLAGSVIGVLLFVPNIVFLSQTGYFDQAAITKPLLHTWSLGVEEQFYLVAPLLPYALRRLRPRGRRLTLLALFGLSLVFSMGLHVVSPEAAFYLMPARLWEFLAGALVAERIIPPLRRQGLADAIGIAASLVLAGSISLVSATTAYPTLLPCLATTALIHIGGSRRTLVSRIIGHPALAGIGLISYSIYLWHWPLIVLARLSGVPVPPALQMLAGVGLLGLAALSWQVVEIPFREPGSPLRRHAARILVPAPALLGAACLAIIAARGLPDRFDPAIVQVASYFDYSPHAAFREGECFLSTHDDDLSAFDSKTCLHKSTTQQNDLIIGDSHAAHLWFGLKTVFASANVMQATASRCKPVLDPSGQTYCTELMREIRERFLPQLRPLDVIILSANWEPEDADSAAKMVTFLQGFARKVVVIGGVPRHVTPLPDLLARSLLQHNQNLLIDQQSDLPFEVDHAFKQVLPPDTYIALTDILCPQKRCVVTASPGVPLQFDTDHFTSAGSILVAREIARRHLLDLH